MINDQQVDNPPPNCFANREGGGGGTSDILIHVRAHSFPCPCENLFLALVGCCGMITAIQYVGPAIAETTRLSRLK